MAKRKLPKGIREKNGAYEARAMVNGIKINMYSANLDKLIEDFEHAKEQARRRVHYMKSEISLNEWLQFSIHPIRFHSKALCAEAAVSASFPGTFRIRP